MGGAAAAVLVLATVALLFWPREKSASTPDQPAVQTTAPAQTATPAAAANPPAAQSGPATAAGSTQPAKLTRAEALAAARAAKNAQKGGVKPSEQPTAENPQPERQQPAKTQSEAPRGRCDLEPSQYSGQVAQAEKNLARGKYADAQREFGAVLACDSGNGRAKEGLERARMAAREADGGSSN
jgi:anthranilate/para-aminobenzoate synthase component I